MEVIPNTNTELSQADFNFGLAHVTTTGYLNELIHTIEAISGSHKPINPSKRKDGMSDQQASLIFERMNTFFTQKWPHVIALAFPSSTNQFTAEQIDKLQSIVQDKFGAIKALEGVKQHALVRSQLCIHDNLTQLLIKDKLNQIKEAKSSKERRKLEKIIKGLLLDF